MEVCEGYLEKNILEFVDIFVELILTHSQTNKLQPTNNQSGFLKIDFELERN